MPSVTMTRQHRLFADRPIGAVAIDVIGSVPAPAHQDGHLHFRGWRVLLPHPNSSAAANKTLLQRVMIPIGVLLGAKGAYFPVSSVAT